MTKILKKQYNTKFLDDDLDFSDINTDGRVYLILNDNGNLQYIDYIHNNEVVILSISNDGDLILTKSDDVKYNKIGPFESNNIF